MKQSKRYQCITKAELINLVSKPGAVIMTVEALTDARARKNPHGKIYKESRATVVVGAKYEDAVNRELVREGKEAGFKAAKLPWGKWFVPNKIVEHNGDYYLRTETTGGMRKKRKAIVGYRAENGKPLTKEEAAPFIPVSKSAKQKTAGVEQEVTVRNFNLDNIKRIRLNGRTWKVV